MKITLGSRNLFFTSDYHLFHHNVIKYSNRPFTDVLEMNEAIRDNHNAIVSDDDIVFNLGDVVLCKRKGTYQERQKFDSELTSLLKLFKGNIYYIPGNHEDYWDLVTGVWKPLPGIVDLHVVDIDQRIVLCHYALRIWNRAHYGTWHLYGHSHGGLKDDLGNPIQNKETTLSFDVGVDTWDFKPYSLADIQKIMSSRKFNPIDHHTGTPTRTIDNAI